MSKVWFPAAVVMATAAGSLSLDRKVETFDSIMGVPVATLSEKADTVLYLEKGYKRGWNEDKMEAMAQDSLGAGQDSTYVFGVEDAGAENSDSAAVSKRPAALDTLRAPDSLLAIDPFRYEHYAALVDSACHAWVHDSLKAAGADSLLARIDSIYLADSVVFAKLAFAKWYAGLSKSERKTYDMEQKFIKKKAKLDSIGERKDSIKAYKDSITENTPRILETFFLNDSLQYKRLVSWTHDRAFHKINVKDHDTTYNYHFNDYPFMKEDVGATWLGVAGSAVQHYDFFKRKSSEGAFFYDALESWSYSAETLPFYNTKTPYTELAYWGTLLTSEKKESDNIRIFTSQNITPEFNFTFEFNRYGGGGILKNETTANKTMVIAGNYIGKKYLLHTGYIYNMVKRTENGGILDNSFIRDTLVDAREIDVALSDASTLLKKEIVFLDQQYRIPFNFLKKDTGDDEAGDDVTTAFIGHSSEFATYRRKYYDHLTDETGRSFYNNVYNYNPQYTNDSSRVMRFENKVFLRLQPWSAEGAVSKLDVGVGEKLMNYYLMDPTFLQAPKSKAWSATYLYAGAEGQFSKFAFWDAQGKYNFLGDEINDFTIAGNLGVNFYPFRRARKSPVSLNAHFETSLKEPEFYNQHYYSNHFAWENNFGKISTTKVQGEISIPRYKLKLSAGYALLANNIYYDTLSIVRQNPDAMSVFTARLDKEFVLGPVHLDNKILFQLSSNQEVLPLPKLALNLRYYLQFPYQAMDIQLGVNALYNTRWYAPSYSPALGVFYNQKETEYGACPYFDIFANIMWKRACIFIKYENAGQGWPMDKADYFSANHYIRTQRVLKLGLYWPFYTQPSKTYGSSSGGQGSGAAGMPQGGGRQSSGGSTSSSRSTARTK